jgi:sigma-B regulation protein RsbU (phosphoserine phosphatase)
MNSLSEHKPGPVSPTQGARRETLHEREQRLDLAVRSAGLGTWTWDLETDTILLDECAHALLGIEEGTFSGRYEDFLALVHPEDRERVREEVETASSAASSYDTEYRVVWARDGSTHVLRARGKFYGGDLGKAASMAGACWDITERRRVEAELAHERQMLSCLMKNIPDKIYFKDLESRFIRVSNSMIPNFAVHDASEIIGRNDFDFFSEEHALQAFEDEQRVIRTGQPMVNKEEKETWGGGRETWVSSTKMPLYDDAGRIVGTFGLSRDVTERKRAEAQLAKYAEQLKERNEELHQDLEMARELQTALLPQQYPLFPHDATPAQSALRFSHFFNPSSEVSGDFFDILQLSDTQAGIFICDVMGHGVRAALVAAIVRTLVEEMRGTAQMPGEFLGRVNRALRGVLKPMQTPMFVSAFFAVADLAKGELRYANAGHPHPLCVRHEPGIGTVFGLNGCKPGPALGLFDHAAYETCSIRLAEHDVVMMFTDGLFEVENTEGEQYDQSRLRSAVEGRMSLSAEALCADLVREIQQFSASKDFTDDVCLVTMEVEHLHG